MMLAHPSRHLIRIAGAVLVAGGLLTSAAGARPAASPLAPELRSATALAATTIRLTWRDTNTAALTEFRVHRYVQGNGEHGPGWKLEDIPVRRGANGISTHDASGLTAGLTYCFFVHALAVHPNEEVLSRDFSPKSNEVCAVAAPPPPFETRRLPDDIVTTPAPPIAETRRLPGGILTAPGTETPAPPAPTAPDLAVLSINGPASLRVGISQTYTAAIANEGLDANGTVELKIIVYGALEPGFQQSFIAAGLYCERLAQPDPGTTGAIRCAGGTLKREGAASIAFQARATKAGQGNIVVEINPSRALVESDYDDNRTPTLRVEVR